MEILTYGEDGLTLWALQNKLEDILIALEGEKHDKCKAVFYRPSFGRGRGCFGEFDFIIATEKQVYLGETKFYVNPHYKSGELHKDMIQLREAQVDRASKFQKKIVSILTPDEKKKTTCDESDKDEETTLLQKNVENIITLLGIKKGENGEEINKKFQNVIMIIHNNEVNAAEKWKQDSWQPQSTKKNAESSASNYDSNDSNGNHENVEQLEFIHIYIDIADDQFKKTDDTGNRKTNYVPITVYGENK